MGQEIAARGFTPQDFARFAARLAEETALLQRLCAQGELSRRGPRIGFELEAWLIDRHAFPAPHNQSFLARLGDPQVVAELSRFNIELNGAPQDLAGDGLARIEADLAASWARCLANAHADVDTVVAIGTLPTLREADLNPAAMTPSNRYAALNRELQRLRGGRPVRIDIAGRDGARLRSTHHDIMLEAAATSFQLHLQVPAARIGPVFNASLALSGPLVALAANSPFLFGQALWHETRIAVFEQAFEAAGWDDSGHHHRVTFGSGYLGADPTAPFADNLAHYPVLLPMAGEADPAALACLKLHNGTVWRWNRLLAGSDADGTPHLRIEQRVMPAGPSLLDMLANAAFYFGATHALAAQGDRPELPFAMARANFYAAARHGLDAELVWDGRLQPAAQVCRQIAALARAGLAEQGVSPALIDRYLEVIELRLASGQNGARWQLAHHARHGDLFRLTADYLEHQRSGMPVHEWRV